VYHFIALLWNAEDPAAGEQAIQLDEKLRRSPVGWECQTTGQGLSVHTLPPSDPALTCYYLSRESGVILGRLFKADLTNPQLPSTQAIGEYDAGEIVRTGGEYLTRNFWGGYVALLRDRDRRRVFAIRDCSGKTPCYYTQIQGVTVLFADMGDLAPLELPPFTLNWEYLAAFIYSSQLQIRACALRELSEILPGERIELRDGSVSHTVLWDPNSVYREGRLDSYDDAVAALRHIAQGCISAWAQTYDPILHSLSGGFDSAVVLGCLTQSSAHPQITCINQFTSASRGDERAYARLAAERAQVRLLEVPMDAAAGRFDARLINAPRVPKPAISGLFRLLETEIINDIATGVGARTLWTGQGGDHIFLQTSSTLSALDYFKTRGLRGFPAAIRDAGQLSRQPYWLVLKSAMGFASAANGQAAPRTWFINPAKLPNNPDEYVTHPWVTQGQDLPEGKQLQIRLLAEAANRHKPIPRLERAHQHHPLLSQPLMEICLRIPTYLLVRGGRERALARAAFSAQVPPEILRRRDKGSIVSQTTEAIRGSQEFVRELLLDGLLAGVGVIARRDLEPYIVRGEPLREDHLMPLLACIAAEAWARSCRSSVLAVAA
jgi:asparagine synthase (glutamine-hydrolysing)